MDKQYTYTDINGQHFIPASDIIWIKAASNYSVIYTVSGKKITQSKTLSVVARQLRGFKVFFRIHHSYLINVTHLTSILKKDGGSVLLSCGTILQLARRRKHEFKQFIKTHNQPLAQKNIPPPK